jgi:hypothetical protein
MGPWTHQTHVAFQNVPKLGQFVEAVFAKKAAQPGDPRIISDFEKRIFSLVEAAQGIFQAIRPIEHGPEFITNKCLSLLPGSERSIDGWARRLQFDCQGNHEKKRPQQQKRSAGQYHVQNPFQDRTGEGN